MTGTGFRSLRIIIIINNQTLNIQQNQQLQQGHIARYQQKLIAISVQKTLNTTTKKLNVKNTVRGRNTITS